MSLLQSKLASLLGSGSGDQESLVGVDITPGAVRVSQLENDGIKWTLSKLGFRGVQNSNLEDHSEATQVEYSERLKEALAGASITGTDAALTIPVDDAIIQVVKIPLMADDELKAAIDTNTLWANVIQITDDLNEYSVYWSVLDRDEDTQMMELLFVAAKYTDISFYSGIAREAGLNPVIVDVKCFALRCALEIQRSRQSDYESAQAILEIGAHENYVMITKQDKPHIVDLFVADPDKQALSDPEMPSERYQSVTDRMAMQIRQTLSTYEAQNGGEQISEVIVVSELEHFQNISDCLKASLAGLNVTLMDPMFRINVPRHLSEQLEAEPNRSVFTASIGLATRTYDSRSKQYLTGTGCETVNLIPQSDRPSPRQSGQFLIKFMAVLGVLLVLGSVSFYSVDLILREGRLAGAAAEYDSVIEQKESLNAEIADLKKQEKAFEGFLRTTKLLPSNSRDMYETLVEITRRIPSGVWLESIEYEGGSAISVSGKSISDQNILQLIANLNGSQKIVRASLNTMTIDKQAGREIKVFNVVANLAEFQPALPVLTENKE